jgi:hypothetical protein
MAVLKLHVPIHLSPKLCVSARKIVNSSAYNVTTSALFYNNLKNVKIIWIQFTKYTFIAGLSHDLATTGVIEF